MPLLVLLPLVLAPLCDAAVVGFAWQLCWHVRACRAPVAAFCAQRCWCLCPRLFLGSIHLQHLWRLTLTCGLCFLCPVGERQTMKLSVTTTYPPSPPHFICWMLQTCVLIRHCALSSWACVHVCVFGTCACAHDGVHVCWQTCLYVCDGSELFSPGDAHIIPTITI